MAHVSSHFLRHAYATISLAGDGSSKPSLISVSKSLGHAGLASTQVYLHSLDEKSPSEFISLVDPDEEDDEEASSSTAVAAASAKRKSKSQDSAAASAKREWWREPKETTPTLTPTPTKAAIWWKG